MGDESKKYHIPPIYYSPPYEVQQSGSGTNGPMNSSPSPTSSPQYHQMQQMHQQQQHHQQHQMQPQSAAPTAVSFFKNPKFKKTICWVIVFALILLLIAVAFIYLKKRKQKATEDGKRQQELLPPSSNHPANYPSSQQGQGRNQRDQQYPEDSVRDRGIMAEREADRDAARMRSSGMNDRIMSDTDSALPSLRDRWRDEQYRRRSAMQQQPQQQMPQDYQQGGGGMMQAPLGRDPMAPMSPNTPLDPMIDPMMNQQAPDQAMMSDPNLPYQEDIPYEDDPNGSPIQD